MWVLTLLMPVVLLGLTLLMERLERAALVLPDLWSYTMSHAADPDEVEELVGQRLRPMVARYATRSSTRTRVGASR